MSLLCLKPSSLSITLKVQESKPLWSVWPLHSVALDGLSRTILSCCPVGGSHQGLRLSLFCLRGYVNTSLCLVSSGLTPPHLDM